jgi:hypothetical protein
MGHHYFGKICAFSFEKETHAVYLDKAISSLGSKLSFS